MKGVNRQAITKHLLNVKTKKFNMQIIKTLNNSLQRLNLIEWKNEIKISRKKASLSQNDEVKHG